MTYRQLTELEYSDNAKGACKLYIYDRYGRHDGAVRFSGKSRYPDEEISVAQARKRTEAAIRLWREVRITDGEDILVFHAKDGKLLHPADAPAFWRKVEEGR